MTQKLTIYRDRLMEQGIPATHAQSLATVVIEFEQNKLQLTPTTRWLLKRYQSEMCLANLWRFRLLSPSGQKRLGFQRFHP